MYENFAAYYDKLNENVGYESRTEYICSLFNKFDKMPSLLLDLACGTGGFSNCMANRGISVIGVDMSYEMLCEARERTEKQGNDIMYLCQDAAKLDLYGTVDGAICCLDSLNHITDYEKLCEAIARVSLFLEKDRLFIFDVNTPYKHKEILGDNTFVLESEDIYCVWQNEYCGNNVVEINLDFFEENNGVYHRTSERFSERAYTGDELKNGVEKAGLKIEAVYEEMRDTAPTDRSERIIYVTRKVK